MEDTNSLTEPGKTGATLNMFHEREAVFLLGLLAAIHVFVFSAAFPFFNNVDEPAHFDLVLKYSHGQVPRGREHFSPDSAAYLAAFTSAEFWAPRKILPDGKAPPPLWKQPLGEMRQEMARRVAVWESRDNYEVSQPPLYYALAGCWWQLGWGFGFEAGYLLYWLRFLNIVLIVGLVWLACAVTRMIFPANAFVRLGVPAWLAFMPQTAFYSIGNDMLAALCFGAVFICLLKWLRAENPQTWLGAAMGIAFAATYLDNIANLPLLIVASAALSLKVWKELLEHRKTRANLLAWTAFLGCAGLPISGWMIWCKVFFGDLTGSKLKMDHFGWTLKPLAQWLHHPIFSPHGIWTYLSGQMATFWQGEFTWYDQRMTLPGIDTVYTLLSLGFLAVALVGLLSPSANAVQRGALGFSFISFSAMLGFFALLSVMYDFHNCPYPSRAHPYFTSGRLLLGALIPFLLLFVYGMDCALKRFGNTVKFASLSAMILFMTTCEIATDWPVFFSQYNWFHL